MKKIFLLIYFVLIFMPSVSFANDLDAIREPNRFEYVCSELLEPYEFNMSYDYFLDTKSFIFDGDFVFVIICSYFNEEANLVAESIRKDMINNGIEPPSYLNNQLFTFTTFQFSLSSSAYRSIYKVKVDASGKEQSAVNHLNSYKSEPYLDSSSDEVIARIHKYVKEYIQYNPNKFKPLK